MKPHIALTFTMILISLVSTGWSATVSQWLNPQNAVRASKGLRPLTWDNKLAAYARWYGNQRRNDCATIHSTGPYGENIFWGAGSKWTPRQAVAGWVSERRWYEYKSNRCRAEECGHYTQIVWRSTRRLGCAKVACVGRRGVIFVCEYDPPGNWFGDRPY